MEKRYPRGIMATACVPWTEDFRFDEALFRREVDALCENRMDTVYLFGTAGEGYAVSREQYAEICRAFRGATDGRDGTTPMVGVIGTSMDEDCRRIEAAAALGFRYFQISFPCWGAVSEDEGMRFFRFVCGRFPELRFMHYNNGPRARTRFGAAQYAAAAAEFPNLVAVKHTGASIPDIQAVIGSGLPLQFFLLENSYGYGAMVGESSLLISLCNINFRLAREYYEAGVRRDAGALVRLEGEFSRCLSLFGRLTPGKMDGAYDKLFVRYSVPEFPQRLLPPYTGFTDEETARFDRELRTELPRWFK